MLADRFGLVARREQKEQTILLLTVAKNGPKLKVVDTPAGRQGISSNTGRLEGFAAPMPMLVNQLAIATGRVVQDKTGLTARYDFVLTWTPDNDRPSAESDNNQGPAGPTIFTALREQLGLRLDSGKGFVDLVVVDKIDRPSAN